MAEETEDVLRPHDFLLRAADAHAALSAAAQYGEPESGSEGTPSVVAPEAPARAAKRPRRKRE